MKRAVKGGGIALILTILAAAVWPRGEVPLPKLTIAKAEAVRARFERDAPLAVAKSPKAPPSPDDPGRALVVPAGANVRLTCRLDRPGMRGWWSAKLGKIVVERGHAVYIAPELRGGPYLDIVERWTTRQKVVTMPILVTDSQGAVPLEERSWEEAMADDDGHRNTVRVLGELARRPLADVRPLTGPAPSEFGNAISVEATFALTTSRLSPAGPPPQDQGETKVARGAWVGIRPEKPLFFREPHPVSGWIKRTTGRWVDVLPPRMVKQKGLNWLVIGSFDRYIWRRGKPHFAGVIATNARSLASLTAEGTATYPGDGTPWPSSWNVLAQDLTGIGR